MCEFKDKVAVITGGAQGIGRYTAEMFHKEGAFVCVIDLQEQPEDIANAVRFLCSEKAGFITGENNCIDGGMTRLMIYNDDYGWSYSG